jgi:hypothetical protein
MPFTRAGKVHPGQGSPEISGHRDSSRSMNKARPKNGSPRRHQDRPGLADQGRFPGNIPGECPDGTRLASRSDESQT